MVMGRKVDPDHYRVIAPFPTMATNPGSAFKQLHDDTHANHSSLNMLARASEHTGTLTHKGSRAIHLCEV